MASVEYDRFNRISILKMQRVCIAKALVFWKVFHFQAPRTKIRQVSLAQTVSFYEFTSQTIGIDGLLKPGR